MAILQYFEIDKFYEDKDTDTTVEPTSYATVDPYGKFKMITPPSYISIFSGEESYYDTKSYEDPETGAVYPILNLSDYYTNHIVEGLKNWDSGKINSNTVGLTTHDLSSVILNKQLYQKEGGLTLPGFNPLQIEETHPNDDRTLAEIIRDPYTKTLFEKYADLWDYETLLQNQPDVLETMGIESEQDFEIFRKNWVSNTESQALDYLNEFRDDFGPFRSAVNRSITELVEPYKMKELLEEYRENFTKQFEFNNDEYESRKIALKEVLGGAIEAKLQEQEVYIPDFMRGNMYDMWLDYNLGITTPELNLQAMMFYNDGFKKIIDTFDTYLEKGETFEVKEAKPWGMALSMDDYKDAETYINNLNIGLNKTIFALNKGKWTDDEDILNGQKRAVKSFLLRDAINQTNSAGHEGFMPDPLNGMPMYTWWLIPNPAWMGVKNLASGYTQHMANLWLNTVSSSASTIELPSSWRNSWFRGGPGMSPFDEGVEIALKETKKPSFWKKWSKYALNTAKFALPKANSVALPFYLMEVGPSISTDLAGYFFGGEKSIEYPKTRSGRNIFNAFGWQPDDGERGFDDKPLESLGNFAWESFFGPAWEDASNASNMHTQMSEIYEGVADAIVKSQNDVLKTREYLDTLGLKIISDIKNSKEFISISNDDDKKDFFLKEFYLRAFNGPYGHTLTGYIQAHNTFEGALNIMNKISISGAEADSFVLRKVPKPEAFPQELWDELIAISNMNEEDYISNYGEDSNIKEGVVGKYNEKYVTHSAERHNWYGMRDLLNFIGQGVEIVNEALIGHPEGLYGHIEHIQFPRSGLSLLLPDDDRFTIMPYTHPKYGGVFNQNSFREVNTSAKSIFNLPSLVELNKKVDDLLAEPEGE